MIKFNYKKTYVPNGTTLRDVLLMIDMSYPNIKLPLLIMYRVSVPDWDIDDELAGYCEWDGHELKSLDGDNYSLDDEIISYEIVKTNRQQTKLCVTYEGEIYEKK